jgi:lysophospholipase L1-like esterase
MEKTCILIGDSIRMGYQDTVARELAAWGTVSAAAENGGNSANVLAHLEEWALTQPAQVIHVNAGLHDLSKDFGQDRRAVPLADYRRNVRAVLTRLQSETTAAVVWALTTPVNERRHHENKPWDRLEADVIAYNEAAIEVCDELGVPIDDLYAPIMAAGRDRLLQQDGVHFSAEGYEVLGRQVAACIRGLGQDCQRR